MAQALLPENLWSLIAAHLPARRPSPKGGRPRINDRATLTGILFVLKTGMPWEYLPRELGCGTGMTCWRRLQEWMQAGVCQRVHEAVLRRLREHDQSCGTELASTLLVCRHLLVASIPGVTQLIVENLAANTIFWWINVDCR
jgi:transposase